MKQILILTLCFIGLKATAQTADIECVKLVPIQAKFNYDTLYELVKESSKSIEIVPAIYEYVKVKKLLKDGFYDVKTIDGKLCKVWIEPQYYYYTKRITKQWATTREITTPAEFLKIVVATKIKDGDVKIVNCN
jgi:hypothetical protein